MSEEIRLGVTDAAIEQMLLRRVSAGVAAPDDLARAIMAEATTTRQRGRGFAPRWLGRGGSRATAVLLVAALVILAAVAVAVGAGLLHRDDARPGPTAITNRVESSLQPSIEPRATPVPAPVAVPFADIAFGKDGCCNLTLGSSTVAWLATADESTARRYPPQLYRTTDDGRTWAKLSLPHGDAVARIRPVDADTIYLVYDVQSPTVIAVSHDGGATWIERTVNMGSGDVRLQSASVAFASGSRDRLFQTTDGGLTWTLIGTTHSSRGGIVQGFSMDGLLQLAWNGWQDNVPFDDKLWLTTDSGQTWAQRSFPVDDVARRGWAKEVRAGRVDGDRIVIVIAAVPTDGRGADVNAVYESRDGGRTWQRLRTLSQGRSISRNLLSASTWVIDDWPVAFESTTDGGATWRVTKPSPDSTPDMLNSLPIFTSPDHGWSLSWCTQTQGQCDATGTGAHIFETNDGGATWHAIGG